MRKQKSGKIVNISSGTALNGSAGRIHYVTSKAGVIGFTRCLAREVGDDNINVNAIAPGSTLSEDNPSEDVIKMRSARVSDRVEASTTTQGPGRDGAFPLFTVKRFHDRSNGGRRRRCRLPITWRL